MSSHHQHHESRPTKLHFSQSLRSHPRVLPVHSHGQGHASAGLNDMLSGSAAKGKGAGAPPSSGGAGTGSSRRSTPASVRALPHPNRSSLYGKGFDPSATAAGYGVDRKPSHTRVKGLAPLPTGTTAGAGGNGNGNGVTQDGSASAHGHGDHSREALAARLDAERARKLRPPTHLPTAQTYGHVAAHLQHTMTPAQMRKHLTRTQRKAAAATAVATAPLSHTQPQTNGLYGDTKYATETLGGSANQTGVSSGNPFADTALASSSTAAADVLSKTAVSSGGLNEYAAVRKAYGVLKMGKVNPSWISRYFSSFQAPQRPELPLPSTPNALARTQPLAGTGQLRTSLFGLVPITYRDITVDSQTGRVLGGRDESLPLNGKWQGHRATYEDYPLYGHIATTH